MKTRFYTRVFPNDETTQRRIIQGCLLLLLSTLSFRKILARNHNNGTVIRYDLYRREKFGFRLGEKRDSVRFDWHP